MRYLLHREGYMFKKPKLVLGNSDTQAQEDFVRYYGEFMEAKANNVEVIFIDAETMEMIVIESDTINRDSTVQLLEMLDQEYFYAKEVIVILDNAGYNYSKEVKGS